MRPAFEPGWEAAENAMSGGHNDTDDDDGLWPDYERTAVDFTEPSVYFDAAEGGEGDDMSEESKTLYVQQQTTMELVAFRNAIEIELRKRESDLARDLQAVKHAIAGTKARATRRDKGTTRTAKQEQAA